MVEQRAGGNERWGVARLVVDFEKSLSKHKTQISPHRDAQGSGARCREGGIRLGTQLGARCHECRIRLCTLRDERRVSLRALRGGLGLVHVVVTCSTRSGRCARAQMAHKERVLVLAGVEAVQVLGVSR